MKNKYERSTKVALSYFWQLLTSEKKELGVILTYQIGVGILSLTIPIGVQLVVNSLAFAQGGQMVLILAFGLMLGQSMSAFFRGAQLILVERLQLRLFTNISMEMAHRIPRMKSVREVSLPELVNRFFDIATMQKTVGYLILEGSALVLSLIISVTLLAFYHPVLLAFSIALICAIVFIVFIVGRGALSTSIAESYEKYRVAAWLEEISSKTVAFSSSTARKYALDVSDQYVKMYLDARRKHFAVVFRQSIGFLLLQVIANTALIVLGVVLISENQLTLGQLVAAEIIVSSVLASLSKAQKHLDNFYDLIAAVDKVGTLLEHPLEREGEDHVCLNAPSKIEFKNVCYTYPSTTRTLGPLNFEIPSGSIALLSGSNGSGKSTVVDLLYSFRNPSRGLILMNDSDTRHICPEDLRQEISLIRDIEIVSGTVLKNVRLRKPSATLSEVDRVLRDTGLFEEVHSLPDGLDTQLNPKGDPLSVSQSMRLMIARAILDNPRLIILDEQIDSLDEESRAIVQNTLLTNSSKWTLLITSSSEDFAKFRTIEINLDELKENGVLI